MIGVTKTFLSSKQEYTKYLDSIWDSGWVTSNGQLNQELTQKVRAYLNVPFLNLVSSGTLGIQIALKALDIKGEVITTAFSYVATTSSLVWLSARPVFVDIEEDTFNIDPSKIEAAITPQTTCILASHIFGNPCAIEAIEAVARKYKLKVIYDAAPAFGVKYKGQSLLNYGDLAVLSLHATKVFHTAEGGAIISHSEELSDRISKMANFGHKGDDTGFQCVGINGKLSELHAAMGLSILPHVYDLIQKRKSIYQQYEEQLLKHPQLKGQKIDPETSYNYAYFPLLFPEESMVLNVKSALKNKGFHARRYFYPALSQLPYVDNCSMPVAEDVASRILCLPLSHEVNDEHVSSIAAVILATLQSK